METLGSVVFIHLFLAITGVYGLFTVIFVFSKVHRYRHCNIQNTKLIKIT